MTINSQVYLNYTPNTDSSAVRKLDLDVETNNRISADNKIYDKINSFALQPFEETYTDGTNGEGTNSIFQRYLNVEKDNSGNKMGINYLIGRDVDILGESSYEYNKAYQHSSAALGGGNQAGMTEQEFNDYYYDSTTGEPKNNGSIVDGVIRDFTSRPYKFSRSFAFTAGSGNKSLGRNSITLGSSNTNAGLQCTAIGNNLKVTDKSRNANYIGSFNAETFQGLRDTDGYDEQIVFGVGTGTSDSKRRLSFAVTSWGRVFSMPELAISSDPDDEEESQRIGKHVINVDTLKSYALKRKIVKITEDNPNCQYIYASVKGVPTAIPFGCSYSNPTLADDSTKKTGYNLVQMDKHGSFHVAPMTDEDDRPYTYGQSKALKLDLEKEITAEVSDRKLADTDLKNKVINEIAYVVNQEVVNYILKLQTIQAQFIFSTNLGSINLYGTTNYQLYLNLPTGANAFTLSWVNENFDMLKCLIGMTGSRGSDFYFTVTDIAKNTTTTGTQDSGFKLELTGVKGSAQYSTFFTVTQMVYRQIYPNYSYYSKLTHSNKYLT